MKQLIINRNESLYPPSPKVQRAIKNFKVQHTSRYTEGYYNSSLVDKLSKQFKFPGEQILIFYGLEDFFRGLFRQLNPKTGSILANQHHFAYFSSYAKHLGLKLYQFKMLEGQNTFIFDINHCLKLYKKHKPSVVLLTSPNNPTGNVLSFADLEKILKAVNKNTLVILDEAYAGFDKSYSQAKAIALLKKYPNLALVRTMSKYYGLAGIRVGFALAGKKAKELIRYQNYYLGFSRIIEDIAIAALDSQTYYKKINRQIVKDRNWLISEVNKLNNFKAFKSETNFALVKVKTKKLTATKKALAKEKNIVSMFFTKDLMRISIGLPKYTKQFVRLLKKLD